MKKDITVEGVDEVSRYLRDFPKEADKVIKTAARKAAREWMKRVKGVLPKKEWGRLIKVKVKKKKDNIMLSAGLYGDLKAGKEVTEYMKAYWMNYGTLEGRDPDYNFKTPVKPASKYRKNNKGQQAELFFEKATHGAEKDIVNKIEKAVEEAANNYKDGK